MTELRKPYISVIVPVHNQTHLLRKLLRSVLDSADQSIPFEIVVADDGSVVPVESEIAAMKCLTILRHDNPRGAAAARNTAARAAVGDVLFFLDADTILNESSMRRVFDRFGRDSSLGALNGGASMDPANPESGFTAAYRAMIDHIQQDIRAPESCSFFTTRCGAVRREMFDSCGGFDSEFHGATVEEYEFGYRLSRITPIGFDRSIGVKHHYAGFWKNTRNFYNRVRYWVALFLPRRKFDNFGSCTSHAGFGSILAILWLPGLLLPSPGWQVALAASAAGLLWGYHDVFFWGLRLKGAMFLAKSVLLTQWLCFAIVLGAARGAVDYLTTGRSMARKPLQPTC